MASVDWLSWSANAFARARAECKPVLLSIVAPWCQWCRQMERTSYADPRIVATINDRFVPIRVDAVRRPDISNHYNLGGWPTTAFLTADGHIVSGGTYLGLDRIGQVLESVMHAFATRHAEIAARATDAAQPVDDVEDAADLASLPAIVFASFDDENGGFGGEPKFPVAAPLRYALDSYARTGDAEMARRAALSLDRMAGGALHDAVDGGFFHYCETRDWQEPHVEKLLEVNASLLSLYAAAARLHGFEGCRGVAADVVRYVQTWLADPVDGGWHGSQQGDVEYYAADTIAKRKRVPVPEVDHVVYADANGAMISAALSASQLLDDEALGEFAMKSLERVLLACYRPANGVAHDFDGTPGVRGLLDDQVAMAAACLDGHEATGNIVYEMMAEELMHYSARTMWDDARGAFFDRVEPGPDEIGLMKRRLRPFTSNADAVVVLRRLASTSGDAEFTRLADATLDAIARQAARQGPLAAHYLLARAGAPER